MLTGITFALVTAIAAVNTVYLLRRRTRILTEQLRSASMGSEPTN